MTIALVARAPGIGSGSTSGANMSGSSLLSISIADFQGTSHTVSDSLGNTYTSAILQISGAFNQYDILYSGNGPAVGSGQTASWTSGFAAVEFDGWSGTDTSSSVLDTTIGAGGASPLSTGAKTPANANSLCLTGAACGGADSATCTDGTYTTLNVIPAVGGVNFGGSESYKISSSSENPGWDVGNIDVIAVALAIFKPAGGGGGTHPSSGALIGPGSTVAGSAKRFRAHPSTGALVGPGSTVVGTAVHKTKHVTSGALVGPGARIVGVAAHWHKTTGALIGPGSTVAGTAVHYTKHATSGVLTGPGSTISGSAAHTASVHTTTGALIGPGAFIAGTALHISTAVTVLTPTRGGLPPTKKDRDRYLARERLLDEIRAERVRAKRLENDELEQQLTQLFVQVPNVPEPAPAQPKPLKRSAKKQREAVQPAMDFQPILAKLAEIKIELQKFEEDEDDVEALLLL